MGVVFLAPACAVELDHSNHISMDDSVSIDNAIPSDIHIDNGSAVDGIPSDNDWSDINNMPIDNIVPADVPSDINGSVDANMTINDLIPSDVNGTVDNGIINEVPSSQITGNNSAIIDDNSYEVTDSMDANNYTINNCTDISANVKADTNLDDKSNDLVNYFIKLHLGNVINYEKIIFDRLSFSSSSVESDGIFRPFKNDSLFEIKKTIGLIGLDSSASAMKIRGDHILSLDVSTIDIYDSVLGINSDSIFANLSIDDNMDNETFIRELTPDNSPDLSYFSSDKTFKKCVKTNIFKVRDIWFLIKMFNICQSKHLASFKYV